MNFHSGHLKISVFTLHMTLLNAEGGRLHHVAHILKYEACLKKGFLDLITVKKTNNRVQSSVHFSQRCINIRHPSDEEEFTELLPL